MRFYPFGRVLQSKFVCNIIERIQIGSRHFPDVYKTAWFITISPWYYLMVTVNALIVHIIVHWVSYLKMSPKRLGVQLSVDNVVLRVPDTKGDRRGRFENSSQELSERVNPSSGTKLPKYDTLPCQESCENKPIQLWLWSQYHVFTSEWEHMINALPCLHLFLWILVCTISGSAFGHSSLINMRILWA